jgi:hydroxymethylbilane synthase
VSPIRLGTRGCALALAQARAVAGLIGGETELVTITSAGDVDRARGDKSRWAGAPESAPPAGEIDLAVHSAKDVPADLAEGTEIVATPRRADPFDVVVGDLREGARVGTSALRRRSQLLAWRPDLDVVEIRGNVDTRLAKREAGEVDALVLAAAGLERLGRSVGSKLVDGVFVPAAGQGVIAVQGRIGLTLPTVDHPPTHAALDAERYVVRELEASCHTPIGVLALDGRMRAFVGMPDGSSHVVVEAETAEELTERLREAGAIEILKAVSA